MNIWYFNMNPNISLLNTHYAPSIHINETICGLQRLGHQVQYFSYADDLGRTEAKIRHGKNTLTHASQVILLVKPLVRDLYELYQNKFQDKSLIEPIFRNNSIDLVYERLFPSKSAVSACAQEHHVPVIVESNSSIEERKQYWGSPLLPLVNRVEQETLRRADAVTVVSTPLKRYYEKKGVASRKIVVLPNGVNEKRFSPERVLHNIRQDLGLEDKVVVGFVGNIHPYHGVELLLPLAHKLSLARNNIHFLIVGGGGRDGVKAMLASENLARFFSLVGPVPNSEVPDYIAAMDICLLPRFMWYGSPMKIFEYGVMGKAVVAPDMENIREVLRHGETAYLFEPENITALAQAIQELVGNPQWRTQLGNTVRQHILANHTWTKNAERIVEIHDRITS